jgi:hypothetical protein
MMRKRRAVLVLACLAPSALALGCSDDAEGTPPEQQCARFVDELCGKLAGCQPASERRDYDDVCQFAESVYDACTPVSAKAFDACIDSIHVATCPASGQALPLSNTCRPLSTPK